MEIIHQTPMMKQYFSIKADHPDAFLFYRLGDFYELFFEDAQIVAKELELTLTSKNGKNAEHPIPMCGVPHHSAAIYIEQLIEKGFNVAICEQMEDPKATKGLVKREVIQVITPGTYMAALGDKENRYLVAVTNHPLGYGVARGDVTTGESWLTTLPTREAVRREMEGLLPNEVLVSDERLKDVLAPLGIPLSVQTDRIDSDLAVDARDEAQRDAFALLYAYLTRTQKRSLDHLQPAVAYEVEQHMQLDANTARNLELFRSARSGERKGSLLALLDETTTAMGGRLLKRWLEQPLYTEGAIEARLDAVENLLDDFMLRDQLREQLKYVYDIERLVAKVGYGTANARDLVQLRDTLSRIPDVRALLQAVTASRLRQIDAELDSFEELAELLHRALVDAPPISTKEGGMIREGYSSELDELLEAKANGKTWIANLEQQERLATGIKSLKIGYNRVFGYYLEVTKANAKLLEEGRYERKQTLTNAERYVTPELKEKEALILGAEEKSCTLEYDLFVALRDEVKRETKPLQRLARSLSELDVLLSLAIVAEKRDYVRPTTAKHVQIDRGRHPVIETVLGRGEYVANDLTLDDSRRMLLITGPNMSGKSTYMRQFALIAIMHQIGSFVPAEAAELPLFDRIFTRIGAADDLVSGQSTFMVEMTETRQAVTEATEHSLILLDEIGRGTSTYDGMALAQAIVEYIAATIGAKTLFSTHYHELTVLEQTISTLENVHVRAVERDGRVVFLHEVHPGKADKSYGIHVAELADLPADLIDRARSILEHLEAEPAPDEAKRETRPTSETDVAQLSLFEKSDSLTDELLALDLLAMNPIEAMQALYALQQAAKKG
ncbi:MULTISPECIES: DNA mismatch repair protein MutS [Exiguobacterium]|uniref:DNA mismatch repair protein MutS n=1 Tax=Exiguobacterium alkaliphilum TaxID=1428684 RepID=A0ABT2KWB6_9BACL|nr:MULTISPECIES: DNA mismatch repair protein MutS [Exiguobacterium]MCT4795213.1 DNA mismatch repair protein MutS [Exiguobacterium alkaliphilum]QUE85507.1 DNA mismatch repair protein MutS [Exiguobacterium alkaliphilum]